MKDKVGLEATSVPDSWYIKSGLIFVNIYPYYLRQRQLVPSEPRITLLENFKELCQNRKWHTDNADLTDDRRFFFIDL